MTALSAERAMFNPSIGRQDVRFCRLKIDGDGDQRMMCDGVMIDGVKVLRFHLPAMQTIINGDIRSPSTKPEPRQGNSTEELDFCSRAR